MNFKELIKCMFFSCFNVFRRFWPKTPQMTIFQPIEHNSPSGNFSAACFSIIYQTKNFIPLIQIEINECAILL